jgi:hypothetical protein
MCVRKKIPFEVLEPAMSLEISSLTNVWHPVRNDRNGQSQAAGVHE